MVDRRSYIDRIESVDLEGLTKRSSEKWSRYPAEVLPSYIAEMDLPLAYPVLDSIRAALDRNDLGYAYTYTTGSALQAAFAKWTAAEFNWPVDPGEVIPFPDAMRIIEVAIERFTAPGDGVVVDVPAYPPFLEAIPAAGRVFVANEMQLRSGAWQLNLAGLEERFRAGASAYLLCNPHNPTGRVFSESDLREVLRLASRYGVWIVSDEVHAPLVFPGAKHIPIGSLPEVSPVVAVTAMSASKGWNIAGLKCAVAVPGGAGAYDQMMGMRPRDRDGVGILGVEASIAAFMHGGPWLHETLDYIGLNARWLGQRLKRLGTNVDYWVPEGTYLAWLDCRRLAERIGVGDLAQFFLEKGNVAVSDGGQYGRKGFVRLNLATPRSILEETVNRMEVAITRGVNDTRYVVLYNR